MKQQTIIYIVIALILGAGGGFFGGMKYQQTKSPSIRAGIVGGNRTGGRSGQGFRPVNGDVLSVDDKSMTVKLQDGSSKIVLFSATTTFSKSDTGNKSDVKTGERVAAFGTDNSDGSITAQSVQLNPTMRFGDGGPRGASGSGGNR